MLAVHLGDPRVLMRLESIGVRRLADLRPVGRPSIAVQALRNLIGAAEQEPAPGQARAHG